MTLYGDKLRVTGGLEMVNEVWLEACECAKLPLRAVPVRNNRPKRKTVDRTANYDNTFTPPQRLANLANLWNFC